MNSLLRRHFPPGACPRWIALGALLCAATTCFSATPSPPTPASTTQLKRLSLEELLALDVTAVSRRPEAISSAASAISVITGDDVRRSGATSLADALRFSTGLAVARIDGRTFGVASRGFNNNAGNKLLVLLDGRSLYTPLFSGVFWDVQDTELADLDRIEIVRGPGATMWGANAVNGVISLQTKNARDSQGTLLSFGAGNEERQFASLRHGLKLSKGVYGRVYAKQYARDDLVTPAGIDTNDDAKMAQGGFRVDGEPAGSASAWTLQGDWYHGFLSSRQATRVAGGNVLGRWRTALTPLHALQSQFYYDRVERFVPGQFKEVRNTFDFDSQLNATVGAHQNFVFGLVARTSQDRTGTTGTVRFAPPRRRMSVFSGLIQDEISFADERGGLTVGAKFEHNTSTGFELQPNVRAAWHPQPGQTLWASVARALRTPSRFDDDLRFVAPTTTLIRGDSGFLAEELMAYELGYRFQPHRGWAIDVSVFANRYERLRSQERANEPGVTFVLRNRLNATTDGSELSVVGQLTPRWRVRTTYAHLHKRLSLDAGSTDITRGAQEGNDPRHLATLVSSWDLSPQWEFDALVRHTSSLPQPRVPGYSQLDLRLGWRPSPQWEVALVGQNLLDAHHREFGPPVGNTARELERSFYAKVTWRL